MTASATQPRTTYDNLLLELEERVMNAATVEAARFFHDRLDAARERYAKRRCTCCGQRLGASR